PMTDTTVTPETEATVARPLWRRALGWVGWAVLAVLVLLLGFVGWLHTGWGQDWIRGKVEEAVAKRVDGTVTLDGVDVALFGDIGLEGLHIQDTRGNEVIGLARLDVELVWSSLLGSEIVIESLAIEGLALEIEELEDGTTTLDGLFIPQPPSGEPPSDKTIRLDRIALSDSHVKVARRDGNTLTIEDLTLDAGFEITPSDKRFAVA